MKREGTELHHCIYSYKDKYQRGKTAIFFIRKKEKPEEPYFTLELDEQNMTVVQNRGKYNCGRTKEVTAFEKEWLEYIRRIRDNEIKKMKKERNNRGKHNGKQRGADKRIGA